MGLFKAYVGDKLVNQFPLKSIVEHWFDGQPDRNRNDLFIIGVTTKGKVSFEPYESSEPYEYCFVDSTDALRNWDNLEDNRSGKKDIIFRLNAEVNQHLLHPNDRQS